MVGQVTQALEVSSADQQDVPNEPYKDGYNRKEINENTWVKSSEFNESYFGLSLKAVIEKVKSHELAAYFLHYFVTLVVLRKTKTSQLNRFG